MQSIRIYLIYNIICSSNCTTEYTHIYLSRVLANQKHYNSILVCFFCVNQIVLVRSLFGHSLLSSLFFTRLFVIYFDFAIGNMHFRMEYIFHSLFNRSVVVCVCCLLNSTSSLQRKHTSYFFATFTFTSYTLSQHKLPKSIGKSKKLKWPPTNCIRNRNQKNQK